jgi:uncharacterized membrane protein
MKKKAWEGQLKRLLWPLSPDERQSALTYYNEMYSDKIEAGMSEEEIIAEFGFPEDCAERILTESNPDKIKRLIAERPFSVVEIIGLALVTLILIIPLATVAFSLIVSFAAVAISGVVVAFAGVLYAVLSPFLVWGSGAATCFAHVAVGIACCGVGLIMCALFFWLTKYTAIGTKETLQWIYSKRRSV